MLARKSRLIVYRVQDRDGRGPYRPGFSHHWADDTGPHNPTIFEDFGPNVERLFRPGWRYACAFRSLDLARQWFTPAEAMRLAALGFALVTLQVDGVAAESERQLLAFRRLPFHRKARALPWSELFGIVDA